MYVGRRCSRETQEDWSRKRYTQKVKRKLGFLWYNYLKRMARFCACVSQVLTKMFGAFAFSYIALKTVYALSFA